MSSSYAANPEKAVSHPYAGDPTANGVAERIDTPNQASIDELCRGQDLDASQVVKVLALLARMESGSQQPVLISLLR